MSKFLNFTIKFFLHFFLKVMNLVMVSVFLMTGRRECKHSSKLCVVSAASRLQLLLEKLCCLSSDAIERMSGSGTAGPCSCVAQVTWRFGAQSWYLGFLLKCLVV